MKPFRGIRGYTAFARWDDTRGIQRLLIWSVSWTRATARRRAQLALQEGAVEAWIVVGHFTFHGGWRFGRADVQPNAETRRLIQRARFPILRAV